MSSEQKIIDGTKTEFDSLDEIAVEWTAQTCKDMTVLKLVVNKIHAPYVKEIPIEDKQGKKTTTKKAYIFAEHKGKTLPVRLNKLSQESLSPVLGMDLKKWNGKSVYAVHQKIGEQTFITLKAKE